MKTQRLQRMRCNMRRTQIIWNMIEAADTIAIGGHIRPDGDCVGSCMGLYHFIKNVYPGKEVVVYLGEYSPDFNFLKGIDEVVSCAVPEKVEAAIQAAPHFDLFIALDTSNTERLEFCPLFQRADRTICIDHHITNEGYAEENLVFQASSTSEAVYDLIMARQGIADISEEIVHDDLCRAVIKSFDAIAARNLPIEVAEPLYMGIVHDTGVFKHNNTTRHTMEVAGHLIALGVNTSKVIDETFYKKTYTQNLLLGRALLESVCYEDGKVITSLIPQNYFTFYHASKPDLEGIVDQLRITDGVEVAIFAYETTDGDFKFSLRSKSYVDVSKVSVVFGGGGHIRAAGCTIAKPYKEALGLLIEEIKKQL